MSSIITIGKRVIPLEQIVLVEPFDPAANPEFKSDKPFKARAVLVNRDTVLAEFTPSEFAAAHGFRRLAADDLAVNPAIAVKVETFTPTEGFKPSKPFATRLKWRAPNGDEHSRLLLASPETVIAVVVRGEAGSQPGEGEPARKNTRRRPRLARTEARAE